MSVNLGQSNQVRSSWQRVLSGLLRAIRRDTMGSIGVGILFSFILLAAFAPYIAPHNPMKSLQKEDGTLARLQHPSWRFPFGTDHMGRDLFSQVIVGTRVSVFIGLISAIAVVFVGTNIGLLSGYFGGSVDDILMRVTDIVYGIPFLPFVVTLVTLLGPSITNIILAVVLITWRTSARVVRSQVITLRQRGFVEAAKAAGASDLRTVYVHIMPNVLPLSFVYGALAMGWSILTEANVAFLGYGDPALISWGKMLYWAYIAQSIREAWWWVLPPGIAIVLLVLSGFLIGRGYEEIANPRLQKM